MEKDYGQICYSAGCNNYATTVLKIPFGSRIEYYIEYPNQAFADADVRKLFPDGHLVVPGTGSE